MKQLLNRISPWSVFAATLLLGISAGASLAEQILLVPFWKNLSAPEFYDWYAKNAAGLVAFYSPLQIYSAVLALVSFVLLMLAKDPARWSMLAATVLSLAVLATFFVFFRDANAAFIAGAMAAQDLRAALDIWESWQWVRITLQMGAFVCGALGLRATARM